MLRSDGLLSVVDFYTAGKQPSLHEKAIGGASKECGWLSRWFWQIWFDFDHVRFFFRCNLEAAEILQVSLSPARRSYLEYKFGTVGTVDAARLSTNIPTPRLKVSTAGTASSSRS